MLIHFGESIFKKTVTEHTKHIENQMTNTCWKSDPKRWRQFKITTLNVKDSLNTYSFFVSPERSSERDYVITDSVRSM